MSDFVAAMCVGIGQVSVGYPFDTAKVLIQNNRKWTGLSIRHYYRGCAFPMVNSVVLNCITFPTVERTKPYTKNSFISGALAGIIISPIVFCFDMGKIKRQTNKPLTLHTILNNKGRYSTFARESLASSVYFGSYFTCKDLGYNPLLSGGFAGLCNWTITYPIDVVKSRQISQNITIKEAVQMGGFWKGFHICAIRAVIVNSLSFWIYENVKNIMK
jgi:hypothetical protein